MYELYIDKIGKGIIKSSPYAINCGPYCLEKFEKSWPITLLKLNVIPDHNWEFLGWSGDDCSGTKECIIKMDSNKNIGAKFRYIFRKNPSPPPSISKKNCFIQSIIFFD